MEHPVFANLLKIIALAECSFPNNCSDFLNMHKYRFRRDTCFMRFVVFVHRTHISCYHLFSLSISCVLLRKNCFFDVACLNSETEELNWEESITQRDIHVRFCSLSDFRKRYLFFILIDFSIFHRMCYKNTWFCSKWPFKIDFNTVFM